MLRNPWMDFVVSIGGGSVVDNGMSMEDENLVDEEDDNDNFEEEEKRWNLVDDSHGKGEVKPLFADDNIRRRNGLGKRGNGAGDVVMIPLT